MYLSPVLAAAVPKWVSLWLTPIWLIGFGALIGMACLLAAWMVIFLVSRRAANWLTLIVREGPLLPILAVAGLLAVFGLVGTVVVPEPSELMDSLARLPKTGTTTEQFTIDPAPEDGAEAEPQAIEVSFRRDELTHLRIDADVDLDISPHAAPDDASLPKFDVYGGETFEWDRKKSGSSFFVDEEITQLFVWNSDVEPVTLTITATTAPLHPEVSTIVITAIGLVGIVLLYVLQWIALPKISAVALATAKSEMAQPLFLICVVLGVCFLTSFIVLPYNTFGEDIKMLKDSGLTLIMVLAVLTALWAASNSVSEEIEGRTALTVLSKPIGRRQFILGKFTGIVWVAAVMFILLGTWFLLTVAYKPLYDARETAATDPSWQDCHWEMVQSTPGLVLGFFETVVLAAISVAISTRLPMLANFVICVSIFALGHLTPLIVKSSVGDFEPVVFIAYFISTVLPVLEHFDIKPAIAGGREVPLDYLGMSLIYCVLYSTVAMLLALALFEDRDLA